jgi:LmbE family N-acetylglucosaminyl deacetylase
MGDSTAGGRVQYMQIVAHPDDDLLFLNPDMYQSIRAGAASVTVYTTASEISGNGSTPAQKAKGLQRGVQDAYARMAGVPDVNPNAQEEWTGQAWTVGSRRLERYSLNSRPNVQLVFMGLHDGQLSNVYAGTLVDTTVVPTGSVVPESYQYTKADVISVLRSIITSYQPTVLRYQDPLVDNRYFQDHLDHVATVRFVTDALAGYASPLAQVPYRDYNINDALANLSAATVTSKTNFFNVYARYDALAAPYNWLSRMYLRWPRGTQWAARDGAGRPQAFVVRTGVVNAIAQAAGGSWSAPRALTGAGGLVVPTLSVVTNSDGALQVFARRQNDHHLITIRQATATGSWPATWTDLSNPNIQFGGDPAQVGAPTAVANANGSLWVLVKDGGGGVCGLRQSTAGGSWGSWLDLGGGADVQEGLAAIRGSNGLVSLFASTRTNVLTWRQSTANGNLVEQGPLPVGPGFAPCSPPSATTNHDGTLEVIYRDAGTDNTVTTYETAVGGPWTTTPSQFGGQGGTGQVSLITAPPGADARIMVFARNDNTGVSLAMQRAPDAPYGGWTDLGGTIIDSPATVLDPAGAVVLFAVGADGLVYACRQTAAGANSPFGAWQQIG